MTSPSPSTALIDCGELVINQGEDVTKVGQKERACLETALRTHVAATLGVTAPTTEGEPIVTTWTLTPEGRLTQDVDASRDSYAGDPKVTHFDCGVVTAIPDPLDCSPR